MTQWVAAVGSCLVLCLGWVACGEEEAPWARDSAASADAATDAPAPFLDAPPDRLVLSESFYDGKHDRILQPWDSGVDCGDWANWYCQGQYPNYEAVCPPGANPQRIIRCTPDWGCTCEVVAVSTEQWCSYMPTPSGNDLCSAFEQIFNKGCCKP